MRCVVRGPAPAVHAFARYVREKLVELGSPGPRGALYGVITGVRERALRDHAVAVVEVARSTTACACADAVRATVVVVAALWGLDAERLEVEVGTPRPAPAGAWPALGRPAGRGWHPSVAEAVHARRHDLPPSHAAGAV